MRAEIWSIIWRRDINTVTAIPANTYITRCSCFSGRKEPMKSGRRRRAESAQSEDGAGTCGTGRMTLLKNKRRERFFLSPFSGRSFRRADRPGQIFVITPVFALCLSFRRLLRTASREDCRLHRASAAAVFLSGRLSSASAVMVRASPARESGVGISEKKKSPKSMAATGSADARIEAFPVSI